MGATPKRERSLIEVEAIIVAYAMSRLDESFLRRFEFTSWHEAFVSTGKCLGVSPASMKNLRDEFDPIHPNSRKGWHKRPLRPNRQRVLGEFCDASDEAVAEIVSRLLAGDRQVENLIIKPLASNRSAAENVAERLRTGRLAENFFLANSDRICGYPKDSLVDCRELACGYDFGVALHDTIAIEIKGIKTFRGQILFTDNEWNMANRRKTDYWLVVVAGIQTQPKANLIKNPAELLRVSSQIRKVNTISWRASVEVT